MTADIQAAKERLANLSAGNKSWAKHTATPQHAYDLREDAKAVDAILTELSRLEVMCSANEALCDQQAERARQAEAALAEANEARSILQQAVLERAAERDEARRQMAEQREALKEIARMADEAVNNNGGIVTIRRCEDIADAVRALLASSEPAGGKEEEVSGLDPEGGEDVREPMALHIALDFADNPYRHDTLRCPADTIEEVRRALVTVTAAYRAALSSHEQGEG